MELDGVVWLLQWLDLPFELFVRDGAAPLELRNAELAPDDGHSPGAPRWPDYRRFDTSELFAALERERLAGGMTWADVAAEVAGPGMTPATLKAFAKGGRTSVARVVPVLAWLREPAATFTTLPAPAHRSISTTGNPQSTIRP